MVMIEWNQEETCRYLRKAGQHCQCSARSEDGVVRMVCNNILSAFRMLITFIILTVCIPANGYATAESIERTAWDELWERLMLAGTSLMLITPEAPRRALHEGQFQKHGHIGDAHLFAQGIRAGDFHEAQLWGLLSHGGWRLEGGVLGRVELLRGTVELYGKSIWRM